MERAWIRNEVAVSPVIATILMVAITVVLAAVLYVMVSILIIQPGGNEPNVQLTEDSIGTDKWKVAVVAVSDVRDLEDFKVTIRENQSTVEIMDPLIQEASGEYPFTDLDSGGKLTIGDYFTVTCKPESEYELIVFWRDSGNVRGSVSWET